MVKGQTSFDIEKIRPLIGSHKGPVLEIGFWLIIFGYSSKLGIFPNFFWVSDTYAESPSQSSCLIASFLPVTISIAMDKILDLEPLVFHGNVTPRNFLLVSGVITIMYSLWTLFQTFDIRRISAQVALFHTGGLAIILWLNPTEQIFYILLSINIIVKSFLFLTMGLMRMESGSRNIESILSKGEISKVVSIFYVLGVTFSLGFPLSPAFSSDLIIIIESLKKDHYIALIIPFAASIFLSIVVYRIIPVLALPHRSAKGSDDVLIRNRLIHVIILFLFLAVSGLFSLYVVSKKAGLM
jgi:hydrogenase-4 component F